jgi:hypothetical protein
LLLPIKRAAGGDASAPVIAGVPVVAGVFWRWRPRRDETRLFLMTRWRLSIRWAKRLLVVEIAMMLGS